MKTKTKTNIKNIIKIILAILLTLTLIFLYNHHDDAQREEYAQNHNCEWVVYGAHDICK